MTTATLAAVRPAVRERVQIAIGGTVQGVGFRPFVWRKAVALGIAGSVANSLDGVVVEAEGESAALAAFTEALRTEAPDNARIVRFRVDRRPALGETGFAIVESIAAGERCAAILPDLAPCPDCLSEIFDPASRRYRYPFTNCTHCGPRYSIIRDLPYDRARTTMAGFPMCADCRAEYESPPDRRFHAEAIACPACGPSLAFWDENGAAFGVKDAALAAAEAALRAGKIIAIKGIGGFQLMVDARDQAAVARLRQRKRRPDKPFAVMFPSLASLADHAEVSSGESALLSGPAARV